MSLLAELGSEPRVPQLRHWIVSVKPIGRITGRPLRKVNRSICLFKELAPDIWLY
jgi:hypothetical protein